MNSPAEAVTCRAAEPQDFAAIAQLLELYQYELSCLWDQDLDEHRRYGYDLAKHEKAERFFAHVVLVGQRPAGFALVAPAAVTTDKGHWMEQFFVVKKHRRAGIGTLLARYVFESHPGTWEVGQMRGNLAAQAFWRAVIAELTGGRFAELEVTEGWWQGVVQRFEAKSAG